MIQFFSVWFFFFIPAYPPQPQVFQHPFLCVNNKVLVYTFFFINPFFVFTFLVLFTAFQQHENVLDIFTYFSCIHTLWTFPTWHRGFSGFSGHGTPELLRPEGPQHQLSSCQNAPVHECMHSRGKNISKRVNQVRYL